MQLQQQQQLLWFQSSIPLSVDPASVTKIDLVEEVEADLKNKRPLPSIEEKMRELDDASKSSCLDKYAIIV